jgi:hypothetical protein
MVEDVWKQGAEKYIWPVKDEVSGQFCILHNEELCDLYRSPSIIRVSETQKTIMNYTYS